jgi:soluble lytic murein transglycosylase-like protein
MPPVNRARNRALRALLSALAGGGLTAAGLGGPLAGPALGAGTVNGSQAAAEGAAGSAQTETGEASTTSTSTETTTQPETPTTPAATTPAATTPSTTTTPTATPPASPTPQASAPTPAAAAAPTVVLKRKQKATASTPANPSQTQTGTGIGGESAKSRKHSQKASGPNNVASSPQMVAAEASALAAVLASSEASDQALSFYRIPLFLLPIYKAAAVQYGVPWQILAAINEIETDYGSDLSVSTAGAVGWMQFEPSTWLQYGVDALNAGYADPYNPVDAIFAAARYLRAAGAATNLRDAILAYNHSEEYVDSVLLRAKLISTYPKAVIATLTGLVDGRLPVTGKHVAWEQLPTTAPSSATAGATALTGAATASAAAGATTPAGDAPSPASAATSVPGSSPAPSPTAAAAAASARAAAAVAARPLQFVDLMSSPNASVVAVQDGRVIQIGHSRRLGKYLVLRDVYGDVFTYAGLGSIAPSYVLPKPPHVRHAKSTVVEAASTRDPAPSQPASAGTQSPLTLQVKTPAANAASAGRVSVQSDAQEATPPGMERVRLFAHPGNPDARAAAAASAARRAKSTSAGQRLALRSGSVVASGTVLGRVRVPPGGQDGHLRFAVRPAGDPETVNPGPVLANWAQLQSALHPQGAKATNALLGATASDVFLLSKAQLERAVLAEPGITLDACSRHEVASGAVGQRMLAVLAFLSRSGLEPTVSAVRCAQRPYASAADAADELDISAINGTAIAGHQGAETITELTVRTLLTLPAEFVPHEIGSLMRFPGHANTRASRDFATRIHLEFRPLPATPKLSVAAASSVAHSARSGRTAPSPLVTTSALSAAQWSQLMDRVAALPTPTIRSKPSSAALPDPKRP